MSHMYNALPHWEYLNFDQKKKKSFKSLKVDRADSLCKVSKGRARTLVDGGGCRTADSAQ